MIWKIQKKIMKWYGKYGGKVSWKVKRYRKLNSDKIWKIQKKYWTDLKNTEKNSEQIG